MKLSQLIEKNNQKADFTANYSKNLALRKKLNAFGATFAAVGFALAAVSFILIGVFGSTLRSINSQTALLASLFALLVLFSVMFGVGLFILHSAAKLHTQKPAPEVKVENQEKEEEKN